MASGDDAVKIVDSEDLQADGPVVHVESAEKGSFFSFLGGAKKEEAASADVSTQAAHPVKKEGERSPHKEEVIHEDDNIKTTYDVEEDVPPSLLEQLKRKFHWNGR